jgi:muramoyltetrapeptide carboxypeptidase
LRPGDRIAVIAPASAFNRDEFEAGVTELRRLGYDPIYDDSVFARDAYVAGDPALRAEAFRRAWADEAIAAVIAVRGGYGSVHILPLLDAAEVRRTAKPFIGYSDNTSILSWLTTRCGIVSFHGPMLEGRLARGEAGYDRDTFARAVSSGAPMGEITHPALESVRPGEASGMLLGGTLTLLLSSFRTPFEFDPPDGHVLFIDEVAERPYRLDRMLMQLRLSGWLAKASALVFGEMPECDEPADRGVTARDVVTRVLADFPGPILFGLPSGHTTGACLTLPFGVRARVVANARPALIIEEAAVTS